MLVVLGIIALVTGITLPMLVPMMRTRTLDSALDTVKSACNLARSTAIQQRRMMNLTFLQQTDSAHGPGIVLTPYALAGAVTTTPADGTTITDTNQNWNNTSFQGSQLLLFSTADEMKAAVLAASPWNSATGYKSGDPPVSDKNVLYKCIEPNTAQEPPNPSWEIISIPQTRTIQSITGVNTITIDPTAPAPNGSPQGPWNPLPAPGDAYAVVSSMSFSAPYCIHYFGNYYNPNLPNLARDDVRFGVLRTFSQFMGNTIQYLPTGCQFDFTAGYNAWNSSVTYVPGNTVADRGTVYYCTSTNTNSEPPNSNYWQGLTAWTYLFLPDGEVWTLTLQAQNVRDTNWFLTTYRCGCIGGVSGPRIWGPQNLTSATIIVYATTGQVVSQ